MREPRDPLLKVVMLIGATGSPLHSWLLSVCSTALADGLSPASLSREGAQWVCEGLDAGHGPLHRLSEGAGREDRSALDTLMILPQVHLRKPCYDFYFL